MGADSERVLTVAMFLPQQINFSVIELSNTRVRAMSRPVFATERGRCACGVCVPVGSDAVAQ